MQKDKSTIIKKGLNLSEQKKKIESPKLKYRFSGCFRIFSKRYRRNLGINAKLVILRMFSKKNFEDSF